MGDECRITIAGEILEILFIRHELIVDAHAPARGQRGSMREPVVIAVRIRETVFVQVVGAQRAGVEAKEVAELALQHRAAIRHVIRSQRCIVVRREVEVIGRAQPYAGTARVAELREQETRLAPFIDREADPRGIEERHAHERDAHVASHTHPAFLVEIKAARLQRPVLIVGRAGGVRHAVEHCRELAGAREPLCLAAARTPEETEVHAFEHAFTDRRVVRRGFRVQQQLPGTELRGRKRAHDAAVLIELQRFGAEEIAALLQPDVAFEPRCAIAQQFGACGLGDDGRLRAFGRRARGIKRGLGDDGRLRAFDRRTRGIKRGPGVDDARRRFDIHGAHAGCFFRAHIVIRERRAAAQDAGKDGEKSRCAHWPHSSSRNPPRRCG